MRRPGPRALRTSANWRQRSGASATLIASRAAPNSVATTASRTRPRSARYGMPSTGASLIAAPTENQPPQRRRPRTSRTAMTRWTLRDTNSTAIGGKAHMARATSRSRPASHHRQPSMSTIQPQLKSADGTTAVIGAMTCATIGGYQYAYGVMDGRGRVVEGFARQEPLAGQPVGVLIGRDRPLVDGRDEQECRADGSEHDEEDPPRRHRTEDSIGPRVSYHLAQMTTDRSRGIARRLAVLLGDDGPFGRSIAAVVLVSAWVATWRPQIRPGLRLAPAHRRRGPRDRSRPEDRRLQLADRRAAVPRAQLGLGRRPGGRIPVGRADGHEPGRAADLGPRHRPHVVAAHARRAGDPAVPAVAAGGARDRHRPVGLEPAVADAGTSSSSSRPSSPGASGCAAGRSPRSSSCRSSRSSGSNVHGSGAFGFVLCLLALAVAIPIGVRWGTWPRRPLVPLVISSARRHRRVRGRAERAGHPDAAVQRPGRQPVPGAIAEWQSPPFGEAGFAAFRVVLAATALRRARACGRAARPVPAAPGRRLDVPHARRRAVRAHRRAAHRHRAGARARGERAGLAGRRTRSARPSGAVAPPAGAPNPVVTRLAAGAALVLAVVIGLAGLIQIAPARQDAQLSARYPVASRRLADRPWLPRPPPQRLRLGRLPDRGVDRSRSRRTARRRATWSRPRSRSRRSGRTSAPGWTRTGSISSSCRPAGRSIGGSTRPTAGPSPIATPRRRSTSATRFDGVPDGRLGDVDAGRQILSAQ